MREEEPLKHRLVRKFRKNKINNFVQLESQVEIELLESKGANSAEQIEQISYTTGFQTQRQQQHSVPNNPPQKTHKYKTLMDVPYLVVHEEAQSRRDRT